MMKIRILLSIVFSSACSLIASGQNPFVGTLPADAKLTKECLILLSLMERCTGRFLIRFSVVSTVLLLPFECSRKSKPK